LVVFVVLSQYRPMLSGDVDLIARVGVAIVFLLAALLARRSERFRPYWPVLFALFVASLAMFLDFYLNLRAWILPALGVALKTPVGLAIDKLESSLLIIVSVILLTVVAGGSLGSIYMQRGNLRLGLALGLGTFLLAAVASIPLAGWLFGGKDLSVARVVPWIPWILIFVLANATAEELLFRGLFLRKLEPHLGAFAANLLIAIVFTLHHTGVNYTPQELLFLAFLFPLALAWGYTMQKTDSLWGSVLFHAGMDIPIVLGLFSNLS
jgi:membrane protease YdiL (CAAX protease family)